MNIYDLEFFLVEMARTDGAEPVKSLLVSLTTDSGVQGWGETTLAWRTSELAARREALLPALAGRSVFDVVEILTLDALEDASLACAVETALWDVVGRIVSQPLCRLWGGSYRQHIPVAARLAAQSTAAADQLARELTDQGFHSLIVTATGNPAVDSQTVTNIIEAVGDRAEIYLDGAERFSIESARSLCSELPEGSVRFFIDPLPAGRPGEFASLSRQVSLPIAMSAGIKSPRDVMTAVRAGAASCIVIDPSRVGGLLASRECAAVAAAAGLSVSLSAGRSLGPGAAAMLQLAASTPALAMSNECNHHQLHDDVLAAPLEIVDGMANLPQSPGLGVEVDRKKVE